MKTITDAAIRRAFEPKRLPKKSGMVLESSFWVSRRVRRPRMTHARRDPMTALPMPTHVVERPNRQPNCPAYPMKMTAEKYEVP